MMPLIALEQVYKDYGTGETRVAALRDINVTIAAGEFVAIWGPSGSGKSTLCNLIGLLDNATSGMVRLAGQDVASLTDNRRSELRNRMIGFIFQSFNLIPVLSALENVMLPLHIQGKKLPRPGKKPGNVWQIWGLPPIWHVARTSFLAGNSSVSPSCGR